MSYPETFVVERREVHHLPSCPCESCSNERTRLDLPSGRVSLTPPDAHSLGYIPPLSFEGSVARQIASRRG